MFGYKLVKADGRTDWLTLRRTLYCLLATWVVAVRIAGMDPFDDFFAPKVVSFSTLMDLLGVIGVYLICWHILWAARPKVSA